MRTIQEFSRPHNISSNEKSDLQKRESVGCFENLAQYDRAIVAEFVERELRYFSSESLRNAVKRFSPEDRKNLTKRLRNFQKRNALG